MRIVRQFSVLSFVLAAAACGGSSPSAPSSPQTQTTTPVVVPLALTGTWMIGNQPAFTITQNGTTITGTQIFAPIFGSGVVITESGTLTGTLGATTPGSSLTLSFKTTIVSVGTGALAGFAVSCVSTDKWVGQATNTSLTGTYSSGAFVCDGLGGIVTPPMSGPMNYTKQ